MFALCASVPKKQKFILLSAIIIHKALFRGFIKNKSFLQKIHPSACLKERFIIDLIFLHQGQMRG